MAQRTTNREVLKKALSRLPDLGRCSTPLTKCLWALKAAKESSRSARFASANEVSEILLRSDVSLPPARVSKALARAGDSVARRRDGNQSMFRLMGEGEKALLSHIGGDGLHAIYISGATPWSDRRLVAKEALKSLTGEVRIVDKYFGTESLDCLQGFQRSTRILFLTAKPVGNVTQLQRDVARFKKEFPNSQFRVYAHASELHDRYILGDREVWLIGHGIKDLGGKESFVVILKDPFGKDVRSLLVKAFNQRWVGATDF